jgi:flagellar biosynthesis GTPase FlhF
MKFRNPFQSATDRLISKEVEHKLYEKASIDIENKSIDRGVWTKAFSNAQGDEVKQKAIYIELMVEHYRDEIRAGEELAKVLATEADKAKERQRQEEILRQERAEEEREAQEEAERRRVRAEQWARDAPQREIQEAKDLKWGLIYLGLVVIFFVVIFVSMNYQ